jgi:hypothetical protein
MKIRKSNQFFSRLTGVVSITLAVTLACSAAGLISDPAMAASLSANTPSPSSSGALIFNPAEMQVLNSLPGQDQTLLKSMMTVHTPDAVLSFAQQHATQLTQLETQHGSALAKFLAASDVNQYLHTHPAFKGGPNSHVVLKFPDGSVLEYGSTTTPNSSSIHPIAVQLNPTNTAIFSSASIASSTTGGYTNDNYAGEIVGAYADTINFYVYYYSLLFEDAVGNPIGYGADIYNTWPDAAAEGVGSICDYNGDLNIQSNDTMNTSATTTYTVGFDISGVDNTNTWQLETYWDGSASTSSPFYDNFTPWVHT